ncbi:MAG TPA: DMT family transporter [Pseudonocardia sp.]|nr:DMT family transporter [Pseudonocardia sp.]
MSVNSSAIQVGAPALPSDRAGLGWGLLGVAAFSLTVPLTRIAVADGGLSPLFVGSARAVGAALLAAIALTATRQHLPRGTQWVRLAVVAAGVVIGFPILTSYALTTASAGHSAVVIALLPAATAVMAVLRGRERPARSFWVMAALGALAAVGFAVLSGGFTGLHGSDLLLFGAVLAGAVAYAEGGLLARELGAWQTVSWALVLAAPVMIVLTGVAVAGQAPVGTPAAWAALGYLAAVSMYLGFFAWYRGLAIGPMTRVSQVQLVQPVLTIGWAALLLHETLTWTILLGGAAVIACAAITVRVRSGPVPQ